MKTRLFTVATLLFLTTACGTPDEPFTDNQKANSSSLSTSTATDTDKSKIISQPKLGSTIETFNEIFGRPGSEYLDSYGYKNDEININSDGTNVLEVSLRYSDETFLTQEEALKEILKFLPDDAKKVASIADGKTLMIGYESKVISTTFKNLFSETEAKTKGRILVKVSEGDKGSQVRREGETVARITVGMNSSDMKNLGLSD